jgi:hypothetical protein
MYFSASQPATTNDSITMMIIETGNYWQHIVAVIIQKSGILLNTKYDYNDT